MMRTAARCLAFASALACAAIASAQEPTAGQRPALTIPRVATPPDLEAFVGGVDGDGLPGIRVDAFLQREPGDLTPASEQTAAYLSYDDHHFYVVFVCRAQDPSKVRARMARREAIFADDNVALFLDTFNDKQRSYMFLASPLGIQADGISTIGQGDDMSFDTVWHSRGRLTDFGYVVSMSIPFRSLRFPAGSGPKTWGIALMRGMPTHNEQAFWPGITRKVSSFESQFAELRGLDGITPGRNIQVTPYGTFTAARFLDDAAIEHDRDGRAGVDAKVVLRDAITVDVTANPDFSQVESDEPQVTVNQRFEVFFPEKRPFFLENAGYFQTPIDLFFSRRIRDPQVGVRATGKMGGWAVGALTIDDRAPGQTVPIGDPMRGDHAFNGLFRARREFGQSSFGALITAREFGASFNRVASADMRLQLNPRWSVTGQAATADTETLAATTQQGNAFYGSIDRAGRKLQYNLSYTDVGPGFRTSLGFVPRTDIRQVVSFGSLRWRPKNSAVLAWGPNSFIQGTWDHAGELQDWLIRFPIQIDFRNQSGLFARRAESMERFGGFEFRQHENLVNFFTSYWSWMEIGLFAANGTRPNFFPAEGIAPHLARFFDASVSLAFRPASALRIDQTYLYSRLAAHDDSRRIFDNHIVRSRANYQFSRELSVRAIVDYNGVLANESLIALSRTKHITADLLVTYLVNPGTAVHVGYTDGYDNVAIEAAGLRPIRNPTTSTGRQVFVKTSYLFRF